MEDQACFAQGSCSSSAAEIAKSEEEEDEFRSCCDEEEGSCDESVMKMYFKGVSVDGFGESGSGLTGIGVVFQGSGDFGVNCVQKRLDFHVEDSVAEYLALMDGLVEASKSDVRRVFAFTDSNVLYEQIMLEESLYNPLMAALRERVLELGAKLDAFSLKLVSNVDELERPIQVAQVAIGLVSLDAKRDGELENCSICCEDKPTVMMLTLRCSHKFCSHCMRTYADGKVQASQVPIRCPQLKCNYSISTSECKIFLPVTSYEVLERAISESNVLSSEKIYCPYQNCSALLDPHECLSSQASSSDESNNNSCMDCPVCQRSICVNCAVPWHNLLSCEEYQDLPLEERDASDLTLHRLAQDRRWRRCQQCRRMIELTQGCYHMTCWCGHEFCYACGAEYRGGQQTCQCAFWDEDSSEDSASPATPEAYRWPWNSFDTFPMILDAYSDQERSQLALIQRFLAGGFSLSDHPPYQSPPQCTDSYGDAMKDLHQLPWLERFVSVISDNYYDDYNH